MKKSIAIFALLLVPALASAQLPERVEALGNPLVVVGAQRFNEAPADGSSQVQFFMTANVAGVKPFLGLPLYVGGLGVDIRTVPGLGPIGESRGAGLSIPGLTYAFAGDQAVVQVGYSKAFDSQVSSGVYAGFGFSMTSQNGMRAKREAKDKASKKKSAELAQSHPTPVS
jgi:hypothetical protein